MNAELLHASEGVFALRHAKSTANEAKVIVSQLPNGLYHAGITSEGDMQIDRAAAQAPFNGFPVDVFTSPFLRCRMTAMRYVAQSGLHVPNGIQVRSELAERNFGMRLEGESKTGYSVVYDADLHDPHNTELGVESTARVAERVGNMLAEVSDRSKSRPVLLVTHADPGEIMHATALGLSPNTHRLQIPKLKNAELRRMPTYA